MPNSRGLRRKIWAAFIVQVAAISGATILGVYGASAVLKDVLIKRALVDEAGHFWKRFAMDPAASLPDTYNMRGYLLQPGHDVVELPTYLRPLQPGYHSLAQAHGGWLVLVDVQPEGRLVLVFDQDQVNALAFYFGAVPLVLVLVVIYVIAFLTYRISRRAVSPVIWLANLVKQWDPKLPEIEALKPEHLPLDVEGEVQVLAQALHEFASRIDAFVERERNFTRDASHELRSPLTVIRIACDLLVSEPQSDYSLRQIERVRVAARDMEALIESFLILARENDSGLPEEDICVATLLKEELDKLQPIASAKGLALGLRIVRPFFVRGSPRVLSVIASNLLRNACTYTDAGSVTVVVDGDHVDIVDTGVGMNAEELEQAFDPYFRGGMRKPGGQGVGLTIVRRLSTRFGWPVRLFSEAGQGTTARIEFTQIREVDCDGVDAQHPACRHCTKVHVS